VFYEVENHVHVFDFLHSLFPILGTEVLLVLLDFYKTVCPLLYMSIYLLPLIWNPNSSQLSLWNYLLL